MKISSGKHVVIGAKFPGELTFENVEIYGVFSSYQKAEDWTRDHFIGVLLAIRPILKPYDLRSSI